MSAEASADAAIAQVSNSAAARAYLVAAEKAGRRLLKRSARISAVDIAEACPIPDGVEPRVLGALMRRLSRELGLEIVGYRPSGRRRNHDRPIAVWARPSE